MIIVGNGTEMGWDEMKKKNEKNAENGNGKRKKRVAWQIAHQT